MNIPTPVMGSLERIQDFVRRVTASPQFNDPEKTRVARLLNTLTLALLAISGSAAIFPWFFTPDIRWKTFLPIVGLMAICAAARFLLRRNYLPAAAALFSVGVTTMVGFEALFSGGGVRSLAYLALLLCVLLFGMILGTRASIGATAVILLYGVFLVWAEEAAILPQAQAGYSDASTRAYFAGMIVVAAILPVFVHLVRHGIAEMMASYQSTEQARLEAARHQLRSLELQREVAARTAELRETLEREQELAVELQRSLERESELSRLKSQIITTVSHELRTPLTIINTSSQLLEHYYDRLSPEKLALQFRRMDSAVSYLTGVVESVLHVEEGTDALAAVHIDSHDVWTVCSILTTTLRDEFHQATNLRFDLEVRHGARVRTNPDVVTTVLRHLVGNALKFSPRNRPVVVTFALHDRYMTVAVADRGIGIPADEAEKVFDLFYRGSNVDTQRGLGMGLYVARKLTERIGGQLHLRSDVHAGGTTAVLTLSLIQAES